MIRIRMADEPPTFDARVRQRGLRAVAELVGEKLSGPRAGQSRAKVASRREDIPPESFPTFWAQSLDDLLEAYDCTCAYSCFRIHEVTGGASTDHFAPKSRAWDRVYEWSNYRLACTRLNSRKRDFGDVLDPFEVGDDWFALEFYGCQVVAGANLEGKTQSAVDQTIERLQLNDNRFIRARRRHVQLYEAKEVSIRVLEEESPFVARELVRQGRVRPEDLPAARAKSKLK